MLLCLPRSRRDELPQKTTKVVWWVVVGPDEFRTPGCEQKKIPSKRWTVSSTCSLAPMQERRLARKQYVVCHKEYSDQSIHIHSTITRTKTRFAPKNPSSLLFRPWGITSIIPAPVLSLLQLDVPSQSKYVYLVYSRSSLWRGGRNPHLPFTPFLPLSI